MHVEVYSDCLVCICIVTLGYKEEKWGEVWVTIQRLDAFKDIPSPYLECFTSDYDFMPFKAGACRGELFIDDLIKLT